MSTDLLPGGESGTYVITTQQMYRLDFRDMDRLSNVLLEEAHRRGLVIRVEEELPTGNYIVHWRPARIRKEPTDD